VEVNGYTIKPVADLIGAELSGANLTGANLTDANLTDANLTNTNVTNANLTNARWSLGWQNKVVGAREEPIEARRLAALKHLEERENLDGWG